MQIISQNFIFVWNCHCISCQLIFSENLFYLHDHVYWSNRRRFTGIVYTLVDSMWNITVASRSDFCMLFQEDLVCIGWQNSGNLSRDNWNLTVFGGVFIVLSFLLFANVKATILCLDYYILEFESSIWELNFFLLGRSGNYFYPKKMSFCERETINEISWHEIFLNICFSLFENSAFRTLDKQVGAL